MKHKNDSYLSPFYLQATARSRGGESCLAPGRGSKVPISSLDIRDVITDHIMRELSNFESKNILGLDKYAPVVMSLDANNDLSFCWEFFRE